MFGNLGFEHILIIAALALVFLGPEKFPEFAKIALRAFRDFRSYIDDIKREMAEELNPVKKELNQLARYNPEDYVETLAKAVASVADKPVSETKEIPASTASTESQAPPEPEKSVAAPTSPDPQTPTEPQPPTL